MVAEVVPTSTLEVVEIVRSSSRLWIGNPSGPKTPFRCARRQPEDTVLRLEGLTGIVEFSDADQVVVVKAGTRIAELQLALVERGHCLPLFGKVAAERDSALSTAALLAGLPGSVGGSLSMNLPHAFQAQCGSWRDWVLGLTVVRADGTIAKGGSKAVKNVAGYDVQKMFVGARGSLGVVVEVILRTFPIRAFPNSVATIDSDDFGHPITIQRTLHTDFRTARSAAGKQLLASDAGSSTLWSSAAHPERFAHDWILQSGRGLENVELGVTQRLWMGNARRALDPLGKFLGDREFEMSPTVD